MLVETVRAWPNPKHDEPPTRCPKQLVSDGDDCLHASHWSGSRNLHPAIVAPITPKFLPRYEDSAHHRYNQPVFSHEPKIMEYESIKLTDLEMLHKVFRALRSHDGLGYIFRGHAQLSWELLPKAGRSEFNLPNDRDLGRFSAWSKKAVAYASLSSSYLEQLALAQHHGLATRLLDWSMNPLVACYFACSDHLDKDGAVWMYELEDVIMTNQVTRDMLERQRGVFGFIPKAAFPRIINQKGLFTVHCDAAHVIDVKESRLGKGQPNLICLHVPAALKAEILALLEDYGVDRSFLFPDLDGLSAHVNAVTSRMRKPGEDN
ncbi:FRG domain-containing protein [Caballeronia sp. KNU42]